MSEVGFIFGSRRDRKEPLNLDFLASLPPVASQPDQASESPVPEEPPLYLDPAREPGTAPPGTTYGGFAGDPASAYLNRAPRPSRGSRSGRWLLAIGLAAVAALSVAAALWSYPRLERRLTAGSAPTAPAPAASVAAAPTPAPAVMPPAEVPEVKVPAQLDADAIAPAPPVREQVTSEPAPEVAKANPAEPRKARRPQRAAADDEAATAAANIAGAYAPESTLSAQLAGQPRSAGY